MKTMKLVLIALCLMTSCINSILPNEEEGKTMLKPAIHNAINFSNDFNRESNFFDPDLQRVKNIASHSGGCLFFEFTPAKMPASAPNATLKMNFSDGTSISQIQTTVLEFDDHYIYVFLMLNTLYQLDFYYYLTVAGYYDILYSEQCRFYASANLETEKIISLVAYNNDSTHGYISETYPATGFFQYSEFSNRVFGNEKVEYAYSYGRRKILSSENFIKTRLTFVNLSMYQQNLLKWLCNCENLYINDTAYYLVSDFTEKNKSDDNEICDLQAEFIPVNQSFFATGASETPGKLTKDNLFMP